MNECHPSIYFTMEISRQQQVTIPWHDDRKERLRTGNQRIPKTNEQWSPSTFSEPRGYALQEIID